MARADASERQRDRADGRLVEAVEVRVVEGVLGDDALVRRVVEHLGDEVDAGVVEARRVEVGDAVAQRLRLPLGELGLVVGELKRGVGRRRR